MRYGLTKAEMKRAEKNILRKLKKETTRRWDGTAKALRGSIQAKLPKK